MVVQVTETVKLVLSVGESFISQDGQKYVKGEVYSVPKEEANKLLAVKADYDIRFFKKYEGGAVKTSVAQDVTTQEVHPTAQQIAVSMNEANQESYEAAKALNKADMISSATRGHGDEHIEKQLEAKDRISVVGPTSQGLSQEIDTAENRVPRGRGRPAGGGVPV